ncbi:GNAT family N-acetyltransferase [Neisseria sp. Ec49-e6-T10]|uniref:GNAT family N-acetyltransferase n=1 Tax=Neisseria sp. Ec49-e6-T10 TaxID=3140744 RepID=UPI003EBFF976
MDFFVRQMQASDIQAVLTMQTLVYPESLLEDADFYLNRLQLSPNLCLVAEQRGLLIGYLISYPWQIDYPPQLNEVLADIPTKANSWFVHDCAVIPQAQGLGVARGLLNKAEKNAREKQLSYASLVSLGQAVTYWQKQNYHFVEKNMGKKLACYGDGAAYMYKKL